jgi:integrase
MLYRRGNTWWYKFRFSGQIVRESARTESKTIAREAERRRRQQLVESYHGFRKRARPLLFSVASKDWLDLKRPALAKKSCRIEEINLAHLRPVFGGMLISDIRSQDIAAYQQSRLKEGAAPKTVNLEIGTLRAILRRHRLWSELQPDVRLLPVRDDVGRAISPEEEHKLLTACAASRSRILHPAVMIALNTGMRYSEIRLLTWKQVDLKRRQLVVGDSKTESGRGRAIPLNDRLFAVLEFWAARFPDREPKHYVFPAERYGAAGHAFTPHAYQTDPKRAINRLKEAWERAKAVCGVSCRFHDLRHTACTRLLEGGVSLPVVASILGWSAATTVRMAKRYGHIGQTAQREAVSVLDRVVFHPDGAQKEAQSDPVSEPTHVN